MKCRSKFLEDSARVSPQLVKLYKLLGWKNAPDTPEKMEKALVNLYDKAAQHAQFHGESTVLDGGGINMQVGPLDGEYILQFSIPLAITDLAVVGLEYELEPEEIEEANELRRRSLLYFATLMEHLDSSIN